MKPLTALANRISDYWPRQDNASRHNHEREAAAQFYEDYMRNRQVSPKRAFLKSVGATKMPAQFGNKYWLKWMKEAEVHFSEQAIPHMNGYSEDHLCLSWIKANKKQQGTGSACLQWLTDKADAAGLTLHVYDYPLRNMSDIKPEELRAWYLKHGFVINSDDPTGDTLLRAPQPIT